MLPSFPIPLAGRMVGVAAAADAGLVFSALDPRLNDGQGARFRDVSEARRAAVVVVARECGGMPVAA